MDLITMEKLKETFLTKRFGWCISLFMPTHRAGRETEQNPIRFKNLLQEVEERLSAKGLRTPEVQERLKNPRRLLEDNGFWRHQSDGLAVFFSEDDFHLFRLPIQFTELVVVTDRFHVKPLLPLLTSDGTFHILAISQNRLRLLEGTQHTVDEINLDDMPETLAATFPNGFPEKQLQFHTGKPLRSGNQAPLFHGHDPSEDVKSHLQQWFRTIDKAVVKLLSDAPSPLVLAGVDTLFPLYKEVNTYPHLVEEGIPGNPDEMKPEDFLPPAWAIVEPVFDREREAGFARYRQLAGTGQTTNDLVEAVLAAHHGRIAVLFVALDVQVWGRFDPENNRVDLHETPQPGDEDLLDFTAIQTLLKGGAVFAVSPEKVPDQAFVAAVLRY
ncbi:MAG: hypothetical protein RBQ72_00765 [Desulfobacterium sp.]|jgi:hypothetical protein|nr:hypothetical protein [Desulfobacterium sp.]